MRNIMLDIETLGTRSSSVILSIGAIAFDAEAIGGGYHRYINIDSCLDAGLTVDGKTIQWWMEQNEEARTRIASQDGVPLREALLDLIGAFSWKDTLVWANGSNFDMPILDNAFHACGIKTPWEYYNVRDYRTVKGMFPKELVKSVRVEPLVAHDALEDARAQALTLQALITSHGMLAGAGAA